VFELCAALLHEGTERDLPTEGDRLVFGRREEPDVLNGPLDTVCTPDDCRAVVLGSAAVGEQIGVPTDSSQSVQYLVAEHPVQERRLIGSLSQGSPLSVVPRGHGRRGTCDRLDDWPTDAERPNRDEHEHPNRTREKVSGDGHDVRSVVRRDGERDPEYDHTKPERERDERGERSECHPSFSEYADQ